MTNFPSSKRWLCLLAALVATATFATSAAPASAATDPIKQRDDVRKQQKVISGEISSLKKTDAQLAQQLADLDKSVRTSKGAYDKAAAAAAAAQSAAELARGDEAKTTANYNKLRQSTKNLAVQLYIHGFDDKAKPQLSAQQIQKAYEHGYMGIRAVARGNDVTQRLGQLRDLMVQQRHAAEAIESKAAADRAAQRSALSSLQNSRGKQAKAADEVERRLEAALAESAALAQVDAALSKQIAKNARGSGASGRLNTGNVDTVTVRGITVARSIGDKVAALMDKAKADGIDLGGYGYRNSDQQIALRKAHCGSSNYDIYEKPSNQCHPPTARPGASMHERGLAIDFTYQGSIITSHSNPAFVWLNKNANSHGLYNLSSEPWHWSTNGN